MRSRREVEEVLRLAAVGLGPTEIASATGIPRGTIRCWLAGRVPADRSCAPPDAAYSHLVGLYLGDGHIVRLGGTYMLRIFFDARYPGLIGDAVRTVRAVAPDQRVAVFRRHPTNCVVLRAYWNRWPELLPQHGPGRKHTRPIALHERRPARRPCLRVRPLLLHEPLRRHQGDPVRPPRPARDPVAPCRRASHLDRAPGAVAALDRFVGPKR